MMRLKIIQDGYETEFTVEAVDCLVISIPDAPEFGELRLVYSGEGNFSFHADGAMGIKPRAANAIDVLISRSFMKDGEQMGRAKFRLRKDIDG